MKQSLIISPHQSAHFAMARVLLTLDQWKGRRNKPIEIERAMLIDFAVQYPRAFARLVPEVEYILRTHGFDEGDLGDYFAARKFTLIREDFFNVTSDLVSRELAEITQGESTTDSVLIALTDNGSALCKLFSSRLSQIIRLLSEAYADSWGSKDMKKLFSEMKFVLPNYSYLMEQLAQPFGSWIEEHQ